MSPTVFPQEILVLIIRLLRRDVEALLNLCLTSSDFIGEARNLLYSQIKIVKKRRSLSRKRNSLDVENSDKLFMTLTTHNTSLAARVKSFAYLTHFPPDNEEYMDLVNRTFQSVINLKRLVLHSSVITPGLPVFNGCAFRLESLFLPTTRSIAEAVGQDEICRFLSSQPDLKSLYFDWTEGPLLPLTLCPNLETLRGGHHLVMRLLPGRSTVRHLEWTDYKTKGDHPEPFRQLSAELSNITILALGGYRDRIPLRSLMLCFTSLRVLRLMGFTRVWDTAEFEHDIPLLPNLHAFVWSTESPRWQLSDPNRHTFGQDRQQQSAITAIWFTKMDTLDKVYFRVSDKQLGTKIFAYWKRGEVEPTYVDYKEALLANGLCSWFSEGIYEL